MGTVPAAFDDILSQVLEDFNKEIWKEHKVVEFKPLIFRTQKKEGKVKPVEPNRWQYWKQRCLEAEDENLLHLQREAGCMCADITDEIKGNARTVGIPFEFRNKNGMTTAVGSVIYREFGSEHFIKILDHSENENEVMRVKVGGTK